jgi:hypothetical protein
LQILGYGVPNPWRFSFDRTTGDLRIGDVGQYMDGNGELYAASGDGTLYRLRPQPLRLRRICGACEPRAA